MGIASSGRWSRARRSSWLGVDVADARATIAELLEDLRAADAHSGTPPT